MAWIKRLARVLLFWRRPASPPAEVEASREHEPTAAEMGVVRMSAAMNMVGATALALPLYPKESAAPIVADQAITHKWHFRAHILDRLDDYMAAMERVKRHDRDNYDLFARIGLSIPFVYSAPWGEGVPVQSVGDKRIGWGGILVAGLPDDNKSDEVPPNFVYFTRFKKPQHVERFDGDVYEMTVVYSLSKKFTAPMKCHVGVGGDGRPVLLKSQQVRWESFRPQHSRRGRPHRGAQMHARVVTMGLPDWLYQQPDAAGGQWRNPMEWAPRAFWLAYMTVLGCQANIIVRASRRGVTAAFGIDVERAKYFFRDREVDATAPDGKKKRIFHSVVKHDRVLGPERVVSVRQHYRGLRRFEWNTYAVTIAFPGNEKALNPEGLAANYYSDLPPREAATQLRAERVGEMMAEVLAR